jgi:hypothetical protein
MNSSQRFQNAVLDLLVNGPSSCAGIYGSVLRHSESGKEAGAVSWLLRSLGDMMERGLLQAAMMADAGFVPANPGDIDSACAAYESWLPTANPDELASDEIGLWFELTPLGRAEWLRGNTDVVDPWLLDEDLYEGTVRVCAETEQLAFERLQWWLAQNPGTTLEEYRTRPVASFTPRHGQPVSGGTEVVGRVRRGPSGRHPEKSNIT